MKYKIEHDRENCISCGSCWTICPDSWEEGSDGKAQLKNGEVDDLGCNKEAAEACPVNVIHITELGKKII
ncbi:MAG: ferredoxin [Candidatus Woesearchaeota archaeon]